MYILRTLEIEPICQNIWAVTTVFIQYDFVMLSYTLGRILLYVWMYAYMYVCMHAFVHLSMYVCNYLCTVCKHICTYVCMVSRQLALFVCMHVGMYVCMHVWTYVWTDGWMDGHQFALLSPILRSTIYILEWVSGCYYLYELFPSTTMKSMQMS
mgnify:CR=1 FL=1